MQKMISSLIEIDASCEKIWNILTDFTSYPEWNPFIKKVEGDIKEGSKLKISLLLEDSGQKTFKPVIKTVWKNKQFCWLGKSTLPGLFSGEHMFILEEFDTEKTRFHQTEVFRGVLVSMADDLLKETEHCFGKMNLALKERAEKDN